MKILIKIVLILTMLITLIQPAISYDFSSDLQLYTIEKSTSDSQCPHDNSIISDIEDSSEDQLINTHLPLNIYFTFYHSRFRAQQLRMDESIFFLIRPPRS